MKWAIVLFMISIPFLGQGQIVNTEVKRLDDSKEGWAGTADINFALIKNKKEIIQLGSRMNIHHYKNKHRTMLLGKVGLWSADQDPLVNQGFLHVRHSFELRQFLIPEFFIQGQYNEIQLLQVRGLAGLGPRYRLIRNDTMSLYLGTLYMFELERIKDQIDPNLANRLSAYVSFKYAISKTLTLRTISYYQPRLDWFGDFRISSETALKFNITTKVYFSTLFNLFYDTRPPTGVQTTFYTFKNSLGVKF